MQRIILTLALAGYTTAAGAFAFNDAPVQTIAPEQSGVPLWQEAVVETGDTLSRYCQDFVAHFALPVSVADCVGTVGSINGFSTDQQFNVLTVGQRIWLPSFENTLEGIEAQTAQRQGIATVRSFGDIATVRDALGIEALEARLATLEANSLSEEEVNALVQTALAGLPEGVTLGQLTALEQTLTTKIEALAASAVSEDKVRQMLSDELAATGFVTADELENRDYVTRAEFTALQGHVGAVQAQVTSVDSQLSQYFWGFLAVTLGAIGILLVLSNIGRRSRATRVGERRTPAPPRVVPAVAREREGAFDAAA
jgi:hypothetical protein